MGRRRFAPIEQHAPLAIMDAAVNPQPVDRVILGQVGELCARKIQLRDQRRMLNKSLIIFRPGRRKFAGGIIPVVLRSGSSDGLLRRTTGINRRGANRVPAAAEPRRTVTG